MKKFKYNLKKLDIRHDFLISLVIVILLVAVTAIGTLMVVG